jgi:hypothetical protein
MTTQYVNGKTVPAINVLGSNFKINYNDLDLEIGGSIFSDIANIFLPIFDGIIKGMIET